MTTNSDKETVRVSLPSELNDGSAAALNSTAEDTEFAQLMRRALDDVPRVDVLSGVQQRLRDRSAGKFYSDGWTTVRHAPGPTYLVTGILMLAVLLTLYAVLVPIAGEPVPAPQPKPIQLIH